MSDKQGCWRSHPHEDMDDECRQMAVLCRRVAELERAIRAAFDCGMIPATKASDGGAAKYSEQVRVADMLRNVMGMEQQNG